MKPEQRKNGFLGLGILSHSKSRRQLAPTSSKWDNMVFPTDPESYIMAEECGRGMSATVYQGVCKTNGEKVAIKLMDLDDIGWGDHWEEVVREAHIMAMHHHPNLLPMLCCFTHKNQLWMVEPFIYHGSVLNIMKYSDMAGFTEEIIAIIVFETLKGLDYLHRHGMIHRDVKAGNILVDDDGHVYLADFGVSAPMDKRGGSWGQQGGGHGRTTFVGTPCWMAPEVMEESQYDLSADIWSLGITILELAHGHAPFAKYPPFKVVMMTVQNPPPTLNTDPSHHRKTFSKELHDLVAVCLQKDHSRRPTAQQLLDHKFFNRIPKDRDYMRKHLLKDLPDVVTRVRNMREGVAGPSCADARAAEHKSNVEYQKGLSGWNFDVAEIKRQAMEILDTVDEEPGAHEPPATGPLAGRATQRDAGEGSGHMRAAHHSVPTHSAPTASPFANHTSMDPTPLPSASISPSVSHRSLSHTGMASGGAPQRVSDAGEGMLEALSAPAAADEGYTPTRSPTGSQLATNLSQPVGTDASQATIGATVSEAGLGKSASARQVGEGQDGGRPAAQKLNGQAGGGAEGAQGQAPTEKNVAQHMRALEACDSNGRAGFIKKASPNTEAGLSECGSAHGGDHLGNRSGAASNGHEDVSEHGARDASQVLEHVMHKAARSRKGRFQVTKSEGGGTAPLKDSEKGAMLDASPRSHSITDALHADLDPHDSGAALRSPNHRHLPRAGSFDSNHPHEDCGVGDMYAAGLSAPGAASTAPLDDTAAMAAAAAAGGTPRDRKPSRFKVVAEKHGDLSSAASAATAPLGGATSTSTVPAPPASNPEMMGIVGRKLNEMVQANMAQAEAMRTLINAMTESSRGKDSELQDLAKHPLIAVHLLGSEQNSHALVEENARLKNELEEMKKKWKQSNDKVRVLQRERELLKNQVTMYKEQASHQVHKPSASSPERPEVGSPPTSGLYVPPGSTHSGQLTSPKGPEGAWEMPPRIDSPANQPASLTGDEAYDLALIEQRRSQAAQRSNALMHEPTLQNFLLTNGGANGAAERNGAERNGVGSGGPGHKPIS